MQSTLSKYYKRAARTPFVVTFILAIILSVTHDGSGYKSEWATDDGFVFTVILMVLVSAGISLLSAGLLFNNFLVVRNNRLFSFISWMLLPSIVCIRFIYEELKNFTVHSNIDGVYNGNRLLDGYMFFVATLHLACLLIAWFKFRSQSQT